MKEKVLKVLKWSAYPAFYFLCLLLFGVLTFPFDRLKDRLLAEIGKQSKGKSAPVVTIDKMDSYWLTGVEMEGVKIRLPADEAPAASKGFGGMGGFGMPPAPPPKDSVIEIQEAHARARLLPLIIGRVQLDFWASVFGGEVEGTAPAGAAKGDVELKVSDVSLGAVQPLQNLLGIPIDGKVNGEVSLSPTDGKFNKASGKLELSIKGIVVSDGKTKIQGLIAIPAAKVDEIVISGEAEKGVLKIGKLTANGPDLELDGEGKINLREPWAESSVDLYIKFRFTDAYRGKSDTTKMILGEPGSTSTPLIETQVAKLKKAKRPDGFYGFHVHGKLKRLDFTPSATEVTSSRKPKGDGPTAPAMVPGGGKKVGGVPLPLGASSAIQNRNKDRPKNDEKKDDEKKEEPKDDEEHRPAAPPNPRDVPDSPPPSPAPEEPPSIAAPPGAVEAPPPGEAPPTDERPQEPGEEQPR